MTNFQDEHEYSFFKNKFSYCISIQKEGKLLEIISFVHEHGTFIARVAASHYPGEPEKDGLAHKLFLWILDIHLIGILLKNQ